VRNRVQPRAISAGINLGVHPAVLSFFMAGPDLVRWDLTTVGHTGQYRLTIHHAHGAIVEYFKDVSAALLRQGELEALLIAARSGARDSEAPWVDVPLKEKAG
jgi:hypothetical protein